MSVSKNLAYLFVLSFLALSSCGQIICDIGERRYQHLIISSPVEEEFGQLISDMSRLLIEVDFVDDLPRNYPNNIYSSSELTQKVRLFLSAHSPEKYESALTLGSFVCSGGMCVRSSIHSNSFAVAYRGVKGLKLTYIRYEIRLPQNGQGLEALDVRVTKQVLGPC